ncbi:MAG: glycosyltransferase [Blastocatellia bacterium]|nr:MAG: glycosyltransferase [Blastocatellia bacterium]
MLRDKASVPWICCQLGAREHYAVPRAINRTGLLSELITDFWLAPGAASKTMKNGFSDRYHPDLRNAKVQSDNLSVAAFELKSRLSGRNGWRLIQRRNARFQDFALAELARVAKTIGDRSIKVFAYSYAAAKLFSFAKERSWTTVLSQIDPGPLEERLVGELHEAADLRHTWKPAPAEYWDAWRVECELADQIIVNSDWSRAALLNEGVPYKKLAVLPLAFEPNNEAVAFNRRYPSVFTKERPMRVLFLGQINVRKGVLELLAAAEKLIEEPIEFSFVGPVQYEIAGTISALSSIKWIGISPRSEVAKHYKAADLFVFPTHSDGFGLTQLEAQSWKLPIVASRHCGEVVLDGVNGLRIAEVSAEEIAASLLRLLHDPQSLQRMSDQSCVPERCTLKALSSSLLKT